MAKSSGLDVRCYVAGYDISGDANALNNLGYNDELQDITDLTLSATARQKGRTDGHVTVNGWFNNATDRLNDALQVSSKLPTTDRNVLIPLGSAIGDNSWMLVAKQSNFDVDNKPGDAISVSSKFEANDYGLQSALMLTAHDDTHASASNNASVDNGGSSATGAMAMLELFDVDSGTVTVVVQDSADDASFAAISGLSFTGATMRTSERLETSATATIRQYLRAATTGTFTNADFACAIKRGTTV